MSLIIFPSKHTAAAAFLQFDFISQLSTGETLGSATVTSAVTSGIDPNPAAIVSGAAVITGTIVSQKIINGVVGVIYLITCNITTSLGNVISIQGNLAIVDSDPFQS